LPEQAMTGDAHVECVADVKAVLGEGPVWVEREAALYWLDIKGRKIFRLDESGERSEWDTPTMLGSIAPRESGGFVAASERGFVAVDLEAGCFEPIVDPEEDRPGNRFNDGKVDRAGRFWAGSMDKEERQASGALYRLDPDLSWSRADDGYRVTNGPAFSPDGRLMYENDSALRVTYVFDLDAEGNASNRRVFARFGEADGYPDGMTVDCEGCLWIAFWDGWCVRRLAPSGERLAQIDLPVQRPTCPAFGGPALDRLYVTSATIGLDAKALEMQPCAGGLLLMSPGVSGLAEREFAG
jgi:D-xylonolactonase